MRTTCGHTSICDHGGHTRKKANDAAAFVTNEQHRIVSWNRGAEEVLGKKARDVMGRSCHEVMQMRDLFGNLYCYQDCPATAMARRGEPVNKCRLSMPDEESAARSVDLSVQVLRGSRPGHFSLVHVVKALAAPEGPVEVLPAFAQEEPVEPALTARERQVLRCLASGLQNKEVAKELFISHATVRNHVRSILLKLDVHSKLQALSMAFRNRWIPATEKPAAKRKAPLQVA